MSNHTARSISSILSDFLHKSKDNVYEFKKSPDVMCAFLDKIIHMFGGVQVLPQFSTSMVSEVVNAKRDGLYHFNGSLLFITQNGTFNSNNNKSIVSSLDAFIKMVEHNFDGSYPGKYLLNKSMLNVIDGQYLGTSEHGEKWKTFNVINQLNNILMDEKTSYITSLLTNSMDESKEQLLAYIREHIKHQISYESSPAFKCPPMLLKRLTLFLAESSQSEIDCISVDVESFARGFLQDFKLLQRNPVLYDAMMIESGQSKHLSINGLGTASQRTNYIHELKQVLNSTLINDPSFESEALERVGGSKTLERLKQHVLDSQQVEMHEDLSTSFRPSC